MQLTNINAEYGQNTVQNMQLINLQIYKLQNTCCKLTEQYGKTVQKNITCSIFIHRKYCAENVNNRIV